MIGNQLKDIIYQNLGPMRISRKGWHYRNCPVCHLKGHRNDVRGRFGIRYESDGSLYLNCFNCLFDAVWKPGDRISKKLQTFMADIGVSESDVTKLAFVAFRESVNQSGDDDGGAEEVGMIDISGTWATISTPEEFQTLQFWADNGCDDQDFLEVLQYAVSREFTRIDELFWMPTRRYQFRNRLILPFRHHGNLVGYTGRYVREVPTNKKSVITKYHNNMPEGYVYNLDSQRNSFKEYVIFTEGMFDAWAVDGISPMNNTVSPQQADLVNRLHRKVIMVPDFDKAGESFIDIAKQYGWMVSIPPWRKGIKDAAQAASVYGRLMTINSIIESATANPVQSRINWDIKVKMGGYRS